MFRLIPIISISFLLLVILGGYYFWWPEYRYFQDSRLALATKKIQLEQAEEYLSELKAISEKLTDYKDEFIKVDSALPLEFSIPVLFNYIQKISSENGLILENISLSRYSPRGALEEAPEEEKIRVIPFSIIVSGSYSSFKDFLSVIYKSARIIEVNSVNFSSSASEEGVTKLFTFNLNLKTQSYEK